jgi:hypothetical protein
MKYQITNHESSYGKLAKQKNVKHKWHPAILTKKKKSITNPKQKTKKSLNIKLLQIQK